MTDDTTIDQTDGWRTRPEWADSEELRRRYWDDGDSLADLANEYGTFKSHVRYWMEQFDIPRRSPGRPKKAKSDGGSGGEP